jgi:diguanylate cyclase (GGDEF)-like protein
MFIPVVAIVLVAAFVIRMGHDSTSSVSSKASKLIENQIPKLRATDDIRHEMNARLINLYTYYATLEPSAIADNTQLEDDFHTNLNELETLGLPLIEAQALRSASEEFQSHQNAFHEEMSLGGERDWDQLRVHLANAQESSQKSDRILSDWSRNIRNMAGEGAATTLNDLSRLNQITITFSLVVVAIATFVMIMLYARFRDQDEIYWRPYHDHLTGLPNRRNLEEKFIDNLLDDGNGKKTILLIGLDRLGLITSTFGHLMADQLAISVTAWIQEKLDKEGAPDNSLYQFAPGVWLLILNENQQSGMAINLAHSLLEIATTPMQFGVHQLNVTYSIGISSSPDDDNTVSGLLRKADTALREARQSGGNDAVCYQPRMNTKTEMWLSTEAGLRHSLENDVELELFFQPKIEVATGKIHCAEALLRWHHDDKLIPPGVFIPVAETCGLIMTLGEWVLDHACKQIRKWKDEGLTIPVAINISASHFQLSNFPEHVRRVLDQYNIPAEMLELEITEEAATAHPEQLVMSMLALKSIGVTLTIDDFGTGYSSLSYLKQLPIDAIKIDRTFVSNMDETNRDKAIVQMIIQLAQELGFKVVAEGVETERQKELLTVMGCDLLQGFLFSKPVPASDYQKLVRSEPS